MTTLPSAATLAATSLASSSNRLRAHLVVVTGVAACLALPLAQAQAPAAGVSHLRIGLAEDPDVLDPTLARTFVGRIVFAALCDKLVDIDEKLGLVPQLSTQWAWSADNKTLTMQLRPGVTYHDGEKFDAAAVKFNIERHKSMAGSNRRAELAPGHVIVRSPVASTSPLWITSKWYLPASSGPSESRLP